MGLQMCASRDPSRRQTHFGRRMTLKIDLILADYHLDGDDGLTLIDAIRGEHAAVYRRSSLPPTARAMCRILPPAHDVQCLRKPLRPAPSGRHRPRPPAGRHRRSGGVAGLK